MHSKCETVNFKMIVINPIALYAGKLPFKIGIIPFLLCETTYNNRRNLGRGDFLWKTETLNWIRNGI
jgi:hypothetical protein